VDIQKNKFSSHEATCASYPVECDLCGTQSIRGQLNLHHLNQCNEYTIHCPYSCGQTFKRKGLEAHLKQNVVTHLQSLTESTNKSLQKQDLIHQSMVKDLQLQIKALERKLLEPDTKIVWTISDWSKAVHSGFIASKLFSYSGFEWFLGLYTKGKCQGFCSLYLFLEKSLPGKVLHLSFELTLLNHLDSKKEVKKSFLKEFPHASQGWGDDRFLDVKELNIEHGFVSRSNNLTVELGIKTIQLVWNI